MFALELQEITKQFDGILANDGVSFQVQRGSIHALVGENGAGKSTAMNIVYGVHRPDSGELFVDGVRTKIHSPSDAIAHCIGMVHQHFMLIPRFTVAENIILGAEPRTSFNRIDLKKAEATVRDLSGQYRLPVDPSVQVGSLSIGAQQRVELLKLLYRKASILILDEPTPVLTPQEVDVLFQTLRGIRDEGKTVIIITHKLVEVMALSDHVTVMRQGKCVASTPTSETSVNQLARLMVGREQTPSEGTRTRTSERQVLAIRNLEVPGGQSGCRLKRLSLDVLAGEVVGIAGVEGNGQAELVGVVTGTIRNYSGGCTVSGIPASNRPPVSYIPEDRIARGVVSEFSVSDNLLLGRQNDRRFFSFFGSSRKAIAEDAATLIERYDVRLRSADQRLGSLSGGNQQKVVLARELAKGAELIVAHQPTRGLDIGAIEYVHGRILAERNAGKAILLVSSDLEELLKLSDRIAVLFAGEVVAVCRPDEVTEHDLGLFMTGSRRMDVDPDSRPLS